MVRLLKTIHELRLSFLEYQLVCKVHMLSAKWSKSCMGVCVCANRNKRWKKTRVGGLTKLKIKSEWQTTFGKICNIKKLGQPKERNEEQHPERICVHTHTKPGKSEKKSWNENNKQITSSNSFWPLPQSFITY